jgi:hypothetical protein
VVVEVHLLLELLVKTQQTQVVMVALVSLQVLPEAQ